MVESSDAPKSIADLAERLFAAIERRTGWHLTEARSATVEIVRDGSGYALYLKGKYTARDLDERPAEGQAPTTAAR